MVIADGLNYIKGYRYQLWCEAKAAGTRCCVLHVAAREDECTSWNQERLRAWGQAVEEDDESDGGQASVKRQNGGEHEQGENILGELMPESHTAIYGDRVVEPASRSRSSSMDGFDDEVPRARPTDDTLTLKSLYISGLPDTSSPSTTTHTIPSASIAPPSLPAPSIPIPPSTSAPPYSPSTLSSLCMRYEPPSPFSRWDTPLFTIPSTDAVPPIQDIWIAIYPPPAKPTSKKALSQLSSQARTTNVNSSGNTNNEDGQDEAKSKDEAVKRHAATVLPKATASDALQTLESATMDVVKHILSQSRAHAPNTLSGEGGDIALSIPLPGSEDTVDMTVHIPSGTSLSQPMLQRLRRKYTQIQRGGIAHGQGYVAGRRKIIEGFVGFLEDEWAEE